MRYVTANQATASKRRVYFHLVAADGVTPATAEAGGQPQLSLNGGAWTNTGIGTLAAIGQGRYSADLTQGTVATTGDVIETRYKSAQTAECPGDTAQVTALDLDTAVEASVLDAAAASHDTAGTIGQKINAAGGAADPLTNVVPGTYVSGTAGAALGRIGSGQILTSSIVGQSGDILLTQGDSYYAADGRAIDWTDDSVSWPDLTGAGISVIFFGRSATVAKAGSVVTPTGSAKKVRLELSAADTSAMSLAVCCPFHVVATLSNGHAATLLRGNACVSAT